MYMHHFSCGRQVSYLCRFSVPCLCMALWDMPGTGPLLEPQGRRPLVFRSSGKCLPPEHTIKAQDLRATTTSKSEDANNMKGGQDANRVGHRYRKKIVIRLINWVTSIQLIDGIIQLLVINY